MNINFKRISLRAPYLFALLLLLIAVAVNLYLQPNLLQQRVLAGNLRIFLPLVILTAGQALVIMAGGIDLSVGAIVSMVNAILITQLTPESAPAQVWTAIALGCGAGLLAGAFNGFGAVFLRLQPIVTTYATSFVFGGLALYILPRPGGSIPRALIDIYRSLPLGLPLAFFVIAAILLLWGLLNATKYGRYLFAVGGNDKAAYATGVPVNWIRFSTYVLAGLMAALAAIALTLSTGTGDPYIGNSMTLDSIVAVVLGGTRLSGGQGGIAGSILGVIILGLIRNIISFANVPLWSQTLVDALIIMTALAGPGLVRLVRRQLAT